MANKTLQLKINGTTYRSSVDTTLTNEDLNNVKLPGLYNAGGSNSVTNKPSGIDHFGLLVIHRASGEYYVQIIYNDTKSFRRFCVNDTWGKWTEDKLTDTTYTSLKNPNALTLRVNGSTMNTYDGSSPITYDVSKTALGMNKVDNTADVDKSVKHAKTADTATTATTLGSATIGGDSCGVYWHNGKPVKMNATVGDARTPIYFLNGTATACSLTKASVGLSVVDNTMDAKKDVATAGAVRSGGTVAAISGKTLYESGLRFHAGYNNGYPTSYGNSITLTASGCGELFCGWSGGNDANMKTNMERLYYRNKRDVADTTWSDWSTVAFTSDLTAYLPLSGGTLTGQVNFGSGSYYVKADGTANFRTVTGAVYNDYAEFFPRGEATEPGDIVALDLTSDHESYIKATATSKIVAGVHSDEYAMLIGGDKAGDGEDYVKKNLINFIPVSLAGRVMCKVTGPVHRGDTIIVSDIPGVGIATDDENIPHKRVVGYVVEDDDQTDIRRVKIRVKG